MYEEKYLIHYGILGMKWGIRRSPEQLGRHTIKAGTKIYRSSVNPNETLTGSKYVTYLPPDRDMYRGGWTSSMRANAGVGPKAPIYEYEFKLKQDLKVPSREELTAVKEELMKSKEIAKDAFKSYADTLIAGPMGNSYVYSYIRNEVDKLLEKGNWTDADVEKIKAESNVKLAEFGKETANNLLKRYGDKTLGSAELDVITGRSLGKSQLLKSAIMKEMEKRGYNAIVDEAGVGGKNGNPREGVDPLIIFNASKVFDAPKVRKVSSFTEQQALARVQQWNREANRKSRSRNPW